MKCPNCGKELPKDSVFCIYCGKKIIENETINMKKNHQKNIFSMVSILLFLIGLIVFDFILGTILNTMGFDYKIAFYISSCIYILSIMSGMCSLWIDYINKKNNIQPTGNTMMAIAGMILSMYILLVNINGVF